MILQLPTSTDCKHRYYAVLFRATENCLLIGQYFLWHSAYHVVFPLMKAREHFANIFLVSHPKGENQCETPRGRGLGNEKVPHQKFNNSLIKTTREVLFHKNVIHLAKIKKKFPSHITIFGTSCKRPPLVSDRGHVKS